MHTEFEPVLIEQLFHNENLAALANQYVKPEYFEEPQNRKIFEAFNILLSEYNKVPTVDAVALHIFNNDDTLTKEEAVDIEKRLSSVKRVRPEDELWLKDQTEKWCKDRAVYLALMQSVELADKSDAERAKIPDILQDALTISFDEHLGIDFFADAEKRWELYTTDDIKSPFHHDVLDNITNGGVPEKTLTCLLGGTGTGKTLMMCDMATRLLQAGKNVLYISLEMSELRITERLDANILDIEIEKIAQLEKEQFVHLVNRARNKTVGNLVVHEYPTSTAHVGHFRYLLKKLKMQRGFVPDWIFIDYINICASTRISRSAGSYEFVKSIAEEMRGLAVQGNYRIVTATQSNREGQGNVDMDLTNTSESFGLPQTVDLLVGIISTDELKKDGMVLLKTLKNRFGDTGDVNAVTVDYKKMRHILDNHTQDQFIPAENSLTKHKPEQPISPTQDPFAALQTSL